MIQETIGKTTICKWKDGKQAAYSVGGDDSLRSQLYFAIPEMDKRGIHGNWWVNPGRGGTTNYKNQDDSWANCWIACFNDWKAAAARGHDFANHTMHHLGATSYEHAEQEIRQTAEAIWKANPRQRLQLFLKGGGTHWSITDEQLAEILVKYDCVRGRGGGIEDPTWEVDPSADTLRGYVDTAIQEGCWHLVGFHGIGPNCEWGGPVKADAFIALLDYLVERRKQVWCGTHTEVHKYDQERSTASVQILEASEAQIRLELISAKDTRLYDHPLTLQTQIPDGWKTVRVTQNGIALENTVATGVVQFDALPGKGGIRIEERSNV
jgi:hypothetical protein